MRTRHFCIHLQATLSQATLLVQCIPDKRFRSFFLRRGLNTNVHPGFLSRKHFRRIANDGVRREVSEYMPLTTEKNEFLRIVDIKIENVIIHPNLYKQPPSRSVKALKRKMEGLHSKYVFSPADKAANI